MCRCRFVCVFLCWCELKWIIAMEAASEKEMATACLCLAWQSSYAMNTERKSDMAMDHRCFNRIVYKWQQYCVLWCSSPIINGINWCVIATTYIIVHFVIRRIAIYLSCINSERRHRPMRACFYAPSSKLPELRSSRSIMLLYMLYSSHILWVGYCMLCMCMYYTHIHDDLMMIEEWELLYESAFRQFRISSIPLRRHFVWYQRRIVEA